MTSIIIAWNDKNVTRSWVSNCFYLLCNLGWQGGVLKLISHLGHFPHVFFAGKGVDHIRNTWNDKSATCNCVPNPLFILEDWWFKNWSKECLILKLHEMIRMWDVTECPTVFILLSNRDQPGGELKLMTKWSFFLVFLTICVLFPKFLGRWRSDLY